MLDDHQVVGVLVADEPGGLPLGVQGVQGDDRAGQVQALDGGGKFGDLVGLGVYFPLGQGAGSGHVEDGQQVHLAAVRADRAADGLAVRGRLLQQARHSGLPGPGAALLALVPGHLRQGSGRAWGQRGEVAVQRLVQSPRVRLGEDAAERALARRPDQPGPRVPPPAQDGQRLLGAARRPVSDGRRGVMTGRRERAHRQRQHEFQRVPAAQRRARVWDQGQPFTQASARSAVIGENAGQVVTGDVNQRR